MRALQTPLALTSGIFSPGPYDRLQPFLAVAAAAVEVGQPNHLEAYTAYYDAMTREATQRFAFYPNTTSLAAAIMGSGQVAPLTTAEDQEPDSSSAGMSFHYNSSLLSGVPAPTSSFTSKMTHYTACTDSPNDSTKAVLVPDEGMTRRPKVATYVNKSAKRARLTQSWPCSCSCSLSEEGNGSVDTTRSHIIHRSSPDDYAFNQLSASNDPQPTTLAPFECAKSFIRRRNARERERVRCVNAGYESLRRSLPLATLPDRRLAKVEILRGAINYIKALKELLEK